MASEFALVCNPAGAGDTLVTELEDLRSLSLEALLERAMFQSLCAANSSRLPRRD